MRREVALLGVALPLLLIAAAVWQAEHHRRTAEVWHFQIGGYDPRDLLRGHYLRFRIQLDEADPIERCADRASPACCLCLERRGAAEPPQVREASCEVARQRCDGTLQRRFVQELDRFYIPEIGAAELENRVARAQAAGQAQILLAISPDGEARIVDLWLDGRPLAEQRESTPSGP